MDVPAFSAGAPRDQIRQLPGRLDAPATALSVDRRRDAPRARLLAVFPQYPRQLVRRIRVHDRGRVERPAPVHAPVARPVRLKTEAALCSVDVALRDPKIEHGAFHAPPAD